MLEKKDAEKSLLSIFSYFLEDYSFKKTFQNDRYSFYSQGFQLGLESDQCKILFTKEPELKHVSLWIGLLSAPFKNPDASGADGWFNLLVMSHFVSGKVVSTKEDYDNLGPLERLVSISRELHPVIPKILEYFEDDKKIISWLPSYKEFIKKEYKRQ